MTTFYKKVITGGRKIWSKIVLRAKMEKAQKQDPSQSPEKNMVDAGTQYLEEKITKKAEQTMGNRTKIDIHAPEIEEAIAQLKEENGVDRHSNMKDIDKLFESKYGCKIVSEDAYGVKGHVYFPDEQHYTYFLLRFGKSDTKRKRVSEL